MNRRLILVAIATLVSFGAVAQSKDGGIDSKMMEQIRKSYTNSPDQRAVKNALASTPISKLIINSENLAMCDTNFSHTVNTRGITNQKSSGRCWLFTTLNVLRARMMTKYKLGKIEFSQNYCSFHDLLEKSNMCLQRIVDTRNKPIEDREVRSIFSSPIADGGNFIGAANLVMKYGIVPKQAMPETYQSENTKSIRTVLSMKLREYGLALRAAKSRKEAMALKAEQLSEIYRILVQCMGVPPTEFEWTMRNRNGKVISTEKYTPMSFYEKFIAEDLKSNYVVFLNNPTFEYGKVYQSKRGAHVYDGKKWEVLNLPMDRIKEMAIASIKDNTAMYLSCDVGKFHSRSKGVLDLNNFDYESLFHTSFSMNKQQRILTRASGGTHAMTLIAVDLDENGKPRKWMVENSWGKTSGYEGKIIITDEWFDEYVFNLAIERKYIPKDILDMLKQKPKKFPNKLKTN
ncbi:MAG: C1 family peptidase [Alistipes sp.]|nr:C1 family peptidase [Alistipes sp.]